MPLLKSLLNNRWIYFFTLVISLIAISLLAFTDPPKHPNVMPNDKLSHFLAFFTLAFLTSHSLLINVRYQLALLGTYGLLIELVQSQLPYRTASIADFAADTAGALSYFTIAMIFTLANRRCRQQEKKHV